MALQPVSRQSVSDAAFRQLRAEILSGALAPGDALPSERTLTEVLGVNRQAVREALKRLDQAGLVEIHHGGVTRVCDYRRTAGLDLLPALLVGPDGAVDAAAARSVMEIRACIGPDAARLCAERALPGLVDQLAGVLGAMEDVAGDPAALAPLSWRFWELIVEGSDNVAYRLAFNSLRIETGPLGDALVLVLADELADLDRFRAIVDAVAVHDPGAAESAARSLLHHGVAAVTGLLAGGAAPPPRRRSSPGRREARAR